MESVRSTRLVKIAGIVAACALALTLVVVLRGAARHHSRPAHGAQGRPESKSDAGCLLTSPDALSKDGGVLLVRVHPSGAGAAGSARDRIIEIPLAAPSRKRVLTELDEDVAFVTGAGFAPGPGPHSVVLASLLRPVTLLYGSASRNQPAELRPIGTIAAARGRWLVERVLTLSGVADDGASFVIGLTRVGEASNAAPAAEVWGLQAQDSPLSRPRRLALLDGTRARSLRFAAATHEFIYPRLLAGNRARLVAARVEGGRWVEKPLFEVQRGDATEFDCNASGDRFAVPSRSLAGPPHDISVYARGGALVRSYHLDQAPFTLLLAPDADRAACTTPDAVFLLDLATGLSARCLRVHEQEGSPTLLGWGGEGRSLLVATSRRVVRVSIDEGIPRTEDIFSVGD